MLSKSFDYPFQRSQRLYPDLEKKAVISGNMMTFKNIGQIGHQGRDGAVFLTRARQSQECGDGEPNAFARDHRLIPVQYTAFLEPPHPFCNRGLGKADFPRQGAEGKPGVALQGVY